MMMFHQITNVVLSILLAIHQCKSFSMNPMSSVSSRSLSLEPLNVNRRSFINTSTATLISGVIASTVVVQPSDVVYAASLPMVTVYEFEQILKDSAKSISGVAFSGPKLDTAVVTLIDGTKFGISDLYESSTDPRSPLRLIATCRSYNVPTKSIGLEEAVLSLSSSGSKKKRVYMNERVRVAQEKEKEKKLRMEEDERERLAELEKMERQN